MPLTTRKAACGRLLGCMEYCGMVIPEESWGSVIPGKDLDQHVTNLKDMEFRPDDILICTFPKSGTHWICEIVSMVINGRAEYVKANKENLMLEFQSIPTLSAIPSPRILNTHLPYVLLPTDAMEKRCKIIHVERNPKDMAVSFYHHMRNFTTGLPGVEDVYNSFPDFLPQITGDCGFHLFYPWYQYLSEFDEFTQHHPDMILNLRYEDMKKDPVNAVHKVATFLDVVCSEDLAKDIADKCSFHKLKQADIDIKESDPVNAVHKVATFLDVVCSEDLAKDIADKCSFHKLKQADIDIKESVTFDGIDYGKPTDKLYRKGEVGDWKNWFTVAQNEQFDHWLEKTMKTPRDIIYTI